MTELSIFIDCFCGKYFTDLKMFNKNYIQRYYRPPNSFNIVKGALSNI